MNKTRRANTSHNNPNNKMLGKRLWLDVGQLSLSDRGNNKKPAACTDHDAPTVLKRSSDCDSDCVSLSAGLSSPVHRENRVFRESERRMDPAYRKHLFRYVLQPTGHDILPERVSLKNMVQICHSAWNGDDGDDDSSF